MKPSGNIFNWLGMKQEHEILVRATQHLVSVLLCAKTFEEVIHHFAENKVQEKEEAIRKVGEYENSADTMRVEMVRQISEGVVSPVDREELLKFTLTVDRIADWTNGAARMIVFLKDPLPSAITENVKKSASSIVKAIEELKGAVDALLSGKNKEAIELCIHANSIESEEDERKQETLARIFEANLPTPVLLIAYNLAEQLEGITDKIEDASDMVRIIAIKSK